MAVTKLWKVSVRLGQVLDYTTNPEKTANPEYSAEDYQALKDVLAYAKDEEKTEHEFFCDGINCNVAMARDQFITVKEQFGKSDTAMVDIIARAEDAAKIQRISDRFELGKVDKASIVSEAEKDVADREAAANEVPTKSRGEIIVEEAMGKPMQKEGNSHQNPSVAKTDKSPLSERDLETTGTHTDKGVAKAADKKPSVKEKLDRYKAAAKAEKEAERTVPEVSKEKPKTPEANRQTVHRQPKKSKKSKER